MNTYELPALQKAETEYLELFDAIKDSYRGDWDDSVHRSFNRYVKKVDHNMGRVRSANRQTKQIIKTARSLGVEKLSKHAEELILKAEKI